MTNFFEPVDLKSNKGSCTILICDEVLINQLALINYLRPCFQVLSARNLTEFREMMIAKKINLVIAELKEAEYILWERLSEELGQAKQSWIAITAMPQAKEKIEKAGFSTALTKPVDFEELADLLEMHMNCNHHRNATCACVPCLKESGKVKTWL